MNIRPEFPPAAAFPAHAFYPHAPRPVETGGADECAAPAAALPDEGSRNGRLSPSYDDAVLLYTASEHPAPSASDAIIDLALHPHTRISRDVHDSAGRVRCDPRDAAPATPLRGPAARGRPVVASRTFATLLITHAYAAYLEENLDIARTARRVGLSAEETRHLVRRGDALIEQFLRRRAPRSGCAAS